MMQKSNNFEKVSNLADLPSCAPFTKNKEGVEKFMQTENTDFIYKNDLDEPCFYCKSQFMVNRKIQQKELNQIKF